MSRTKVEVNKNDRYGRLVVIKELEPKPLRGNVKLRIFKFRCDCGNKHIADLITVRAGRTTSCGCYSQECRTTHGLYKDNPLYSVRYGIIERCENKKSISYDNYGGRGIRICSAWKNKENGLENFTNWAIRNGYKKGLEIDRIDNNGDYKPSNCRFLTREHQNRNKRNSYMVDHPTTGKKINLRDLVDEMALPELKYTHVYERLRNGNSLIKSLTTPINKNLSRKAGAVPG